MKRISSYLTSISILLLGCGVEDYALDPVQPTGGMARAYGLWTPSARETCTKAQHDSYSVVGPDGKLYPTWHPPTEPSSGCTYGHEHGRDPRGSDLYGQVGAIPLGYANEQLEIYDPANPRNEDHFGHKFEWENDVEMNAGSALATRYFDIRCDILVKFHQGTHSRDAFTNNLHELVYHIKCNDGTELHTTFMAAVGTPGEFEASCDRRRIRVGPATPANSPNGGGVRIIPDIECVRRHMMAGPGQESDFNEALHESWETSNSIKTENGHTLAHFNPYFQVDAPSRYFDPAAPNVTGRPVDMCYATGPNGERATGGLCLSSTNNGAITGVTWDDPRSRFNGVGRFVDINSNIIDNEKGPAIWYTDPFGREARTTPFPGSIRQYIAPIAGVLNPEGPGLGHRRNYGGVGVRAPN
ncbi:MAG TPA: hypothetical protein VJ717_08820 [Gemmatimonadaceae bacterium]|nr:hypothetical protein [Gemmatimonadaceae bacterium]